MGSSMKGCRRRSHAAVVPGAYRAGDRVRRMRRQRLRPCRELRCYALAGGFLGERAEGAGVVIVAREEEADHRGTAISTTRKALAAYLSLKLAAVTYQARRGGAAHPPARRLIPLIYEGSILTAACRPTPLAGFQAPDQTRLIYPSISPRMVPIGSSVAAKIGGRRRSSCQFSLRRICRRNSTLRSIASIYGLRPP